MSKQTVIFLHIPKTAGTTIRDITRRQYSPKAIFSPKSSFTASIRKEQASLDIPRAEKLKLIQGHFGFGIHEHLAQHCTYFTLLRDPIERCISSYFYMRRTASHRHYKTINSRYQTLEKYIKSGFIKKHSLDNLQVRFLSGLRGEINQDALSREALEYAKFNLVNNFLVVGIVEEFDQSLLLLQKKLGWKNIFYSPVNRTENKTERNDLSLKTFELIKQDNELDIELYEYGFQIFKKLISNQSRDFDSQIKRFQQHNHNIFGRFSGYTASTFSRIRSKIYQHTKI